MNIGHAMQAIEDGMTANREGWPPGMFLYHVKADEYPARSPVAKAVWGEDALVPYRAYIALRCPDGTVVPWVAGHSDLLGRDWSVA